MIDLSKFQKTNASKFRMKYISFNEEKGKRVAELLDTLGIRAGQASSLFIALLEDLVEKQEAEAMASPKAKAKQ
ncbi:MAG: hypothetical protein DDT23_00616 [candidate division WS2 bacterium]|nr:hypothetical protein [Candidatus Lithacetigena glycinireducens]